MQTTHRCPMLDGEAIEKWRCLDWLFAITDKDPNGDYEGPYADLKAAIARHPELQGYCPYCKYGWGYDYPIIVGPWTGPTPPDYDEEE